MNKLDTKKKSVFFFFLQFGAIRAAPAPLLTTLKFRESINLEKEEAGDKSRCTLIKRKETFGKTTFDKRLHAVRVLSIWFVLFHLQVKGE